MARHDLPRTKTPTEMFRVGIDFKGDIKAGDTRVSQVVTAKRADTGTDVSATFLGGVSASGSIVEVMVQNGDVGIDYVVKIAITTTQGDKFEGEIVVPVRA